MREGKTKGDRIPSGVRFFVFMRIIVNGEEFISNADSVRELLDELKIEPGRVAVEVNMSVIKKTDYENFRLNDGDEVEIVNFVGGG
ncbi:MAG: sulfur carrier protein ThiS [Nitrospirota bacterium]